MKLSQMFSSQANTTDIRASEEQMHTQSPRNAAAVNRQIRALVPGQTISGEIVGRNGSEVLLKLADDMILNARVDRSLHIELGRNMTFEVKNNGSSLQLSPLFTNVATDMNVLKALDMAALPVNQTTVEMTEKLMEAGLPVNRNNLMQVYREINGFPQAQIDDIVDLHRLQMPVNETNINQMEAYRSLSHQILQGMEAVTDSLSEVLLSLQESGEASSAVKLYQELFLLVQETGEEGQGEEVQTSPSLAENVALAGETPQGTVIITEDAAPRGEMAPQESAVDTADTRADKATAEAGQTFIPSGRPQAAEDGRTRGEETLQETQTAAEIKYEGEAGVFLPQRAAVARELSGVLDELPLSRQQAQELAREIEQFAAGDTDVRQLMKALYDLTKDMEAVHTSGSQGREMEILAKAFSRPAFHELLNGQLRQNWTVTPREVSEQGKVEELYQRLNRQLKGLSQALENVGQTASGAYKAVTNVNQNIDFLQQINQMYTYVQLPLKLQQGEAHGDLYVYTNRKHLAQKDGQISALLHLDMEHLGPVDVYVTLHNSKVNTNFKVQDDEMLEFLSQHMELLTERLRKRGYDCSFSMTTRGEADSGEVNSGIEPVLRQEKGVSLVHYAFDVRT